MQNNYTRYGEGGIIMAEQVLIQFRADKALKQEVAEIYETLGMDLPTAFRMFMTRSKMVKGLPFEEHYQIQQLQEQRLRMHSMS